MKTPRHPAEAMVEFWQKEACRTANALDASRRENAELERHYRLALVEIKSLQAQVRALAGGVGSEVAHCKWAEHDAALRDHYAGEMER